MSDKEAIVISDKKFKLTVDNLEEDLIIIRGDKEHLLNLAYKIIEMAHIKERTSIQMGPHYAGSNFFTKKSKYGLYIYKENNGIYPAGT